jgi:GNAT superfamily N-acetyltransferase
MVASGELVLREATPVDAAVLSRFAARTFCEAFAADFTPSDMEAYLAKVFSPAIQRREISDPASWMMIVLHRDGRGGALAGYLHLVEDPEPASIQLKRIYVDTTWQGSGLGSLLVEKARREGHRRGRQRLWLAVWDRNPGQ